MIYVPLQVIRFHKSILLIVQYKYFKSCSEDFTVKNLILRTRSCGNAFITQHTWLVHFRQAEICRAEMICTNDLCNCTSFGGASWRGQPLNIFTWFIGAGGHIWRGEDADTYMGWLRLVGSLKLWVSFAKEPYKREDILQKKPIILRRLLIVDTPYSPDLWDYIGAS